MYSAHESICTFIDPARTEKFVFSTSSLEIRIYVTYRRSSERLISQNIVHNYRRENIAA